MWEDIFFTYIHRYAKSSIVFWQINFNLFMRSVYRQNIKPAIQSALKEHKSIFKSLEIKQTIKTFTSHGAFSIAIYFQNITMYHFNRNT